MKDACSAGAAAVGLRLRQQRLKRGWSQEGLCRGICAASYLSKIEQGRVQAAPELLALLMKRMDLPWYGENLPELEELVERRYALLLDGEREAFQDSRKAFSQALETILSSPLAADGLVLDAVDRQNPSDIPAALEPYLDRRQLALLRIVQDREPEAVRLLPEAYCFLMAGIAGYEQGGDYVGAMAYLRQGCDLAARDGRVRLMLECRLIMGGVCCNQLDLDGMEEHYRAAERMARAWEGRRTCGPWPITGLPPRWSAAGIRRRMGIFPPWSGPGSWSYTSWRCAARVWAGPGRLWTPWTGRRRPRRSIRTGLCAWGSAGWCGAGWKTPAICGSRITARR